MYIDFFNLTHKPFSIAPDPRFLFMSERHREALAHLLYGVSGGGGFVLLTGEIGAGKTTVCRCFLEQIPENCNVGYIFNPKLTVHELLKSICDDFRISYQSDDNDLVSIKRYVDALNAFLLLAHANGRHNVLIIDEAQSLSAEVLEQLRLLTNLETNEQKLLQIILIGQPELRIILAKTELRQLAQRIIARYHLDSLSPAETARYVLHRLAVGGLTATAPFSPTLMKTVHRLTQGVPRRVNLLCDRALLGAYAEGKLTVTRRMLDKAGQEVFGSEKSATSSAMHPWHYAAWGLLGGATLTGVICAAMIIFPVHSPTMQKRVAPQPATTNTALTLPSNPVALSIPTSTRAVASNPVPVTSSTASSFHPSYDLNKAPDTTTNDAGPLYRHMARLWEQPLADGDPCQIVLQSALRCYRSNKGFAEIRQLDRPAILTLRDSANRPYYALITGLSDTQATAMIGDATYSVNLVALAHHFQGDFVTFWKIPPGYREKISRGDQGLEVDWIALQLAKLNGAPAPEAKQTFDQTIIRQIREFQSAQGMEADGIVGPKTVMQLNHATSHTELRLHNSVTPVQESPRK